MIGNLKSGIRIKVWRAFTVLLTRKLLSVGKFLSINLSVCCFGNGWIDCNGRFTKDSNEGGRGNVNDADARFRNVQWCFSAYVVLIKHQVKIVWKQVHCGAVWVGWICVSEIGWIIFVCVCVLGGWHLVNATTGFEIVIVLLYYNDERFSVVIYEFPVEKHNCDGLPSSSFCNIKSNLTF